MEPMVKSLSDMIYNQGLVHVFYILFAYYFLPFLFCSGIAVQTVPQRILRYKKTHDAFKGYSEKALKKEIFVGNIFLFLATIFSSFVIVAVILSSLEFLLISFITFLDIRKVYFKEVERFEKEIKPCFFAGEAEKS